LFSKIYDDSSNPKTHFAAVMTCDHAEKNCPFIPGAEKRISLYYEDPKAFDNTKKEAIMYDKRSLEIATEMKYVFGGLLL
jgi:arsenate reductase